MKSHDLEKFLNSFELYWGPLSLKTILGMSCCTNILFVWVMTVSDGAFGSWASSITVRYNLLRHSNRSIATFFRTYLGIFCDKRGSQGFEFQNFLQALPLLVNLSMFLSIHY